MSDNTDIEYVHASWPLVTGCDHISDGCDHCYAAFLTSGRLRHQPAYAGLAEGGRFNGQVRCHPDRLDWPLHWRKRRRIFVSDMADLFHSQVPAEFIAHTFAVMALCPHHTFLTLTKRHARMRSLLRSDDFASMVLRAIDETIAGAPVRHRARLQRGVYGDSGDLVRFTWPLRNVHVGVSAENAKWAGIRIPALLDTPAAIRWVSAEPLLGPIDLHDCAGVDALERDWCGGPGGGMGAPHPLLGWVVAGGESGPGARRCELGWLRSLGHQCAVAEVPYFVKQLGAVAGRELGAGPKGGDWDAFPAGLKVRELPRTAEGVAA